MDWKRLLSLSRQQEEEEKSITRKIRMHPRIPPGSSDVKGTARAVHPMLIDTYR
jgi:hypothetical protein